MARTEIPFLRLPGGLPFYGGRHGLRERPAGLGPMPIVHPDYDLLWIQKGTMGLQVAERLRLSAGPGRFMLVPPGVPVVHAGLSRGPQVFWFCHFGFRPLPADLRAAAADAFEVPMLFTGRQAPAVERAFGLLNKERRAERPSALRLERLLIGLVEALSAFGAAQARRELKAPRAPEAWGGAGVADARIAEVLRLVEAEPAKAWRVDELAARVGLSASHLHHLCRRTLGKPIKRCLLEARLKLALRMLNESGDGERASMLEIGRACGYASQHYFSRHFKAVFGVSPLRYRNRPPLAW